MASSKEFLDFVSDQLSLIDGVSFRRMMGEYVIYYKDRVIGGIYDDRFLVKQTPSSKKLLPDAPLELPYEGGKSMISVSDVDDRAFFKDLFIAMADELPIKKPKRK